MTTNLTLSQRLAAYAQEQKAKAEKKADVYSRLMNVDKSLFFKSIEVPFGKMWCAYGIINLKVIPTENTAAPDKHLANVFKEHFKNARYYLPATKPSSIEALVKPMLNDLLEAKRYGIAKTYLVYVDKDEEGKLYMHLAVKRFIPKKKDDENTPPVDRVTFTGINTEASSFYRE